MKLVLDTANLEKIESYLDYLPVDGVTTNPSILKLEGKIDVAEQMKEVRRLIGKDKSLHVQVVAEDYEGMIRDANNILDSIDSDVYLKIPTSKAGLAAIKTLKAEGVNVTATAIYSKIQALLALELGADYLAPYVNRMSNLNSDPYDLIRTVSKQIEVKDSETRILSASFKNINQVVSAVEAGSSHVTVSADVIDTFLANANISKATSDFAKDWYSIHNKYEF